jgi:hypothetical protein
LCFLCLVCQSCDIFPRNNNVPRWLGRKSQADSPYFAQICEDILVLIALIVRVGNPAARRKKREGDGGEVKWPSGTVEVPRRLPKRKQKENPFHQLKKLFCLWTIYKCVIKTAWRWARVNYWLDGPQKINQQYLLFCFHSISSGQSQQITPPGSAPPDDGVKHMDKQYFT